jgi:hypothetical protein
VSSKRPAAPVQTAATYVLPLFHFGKYTSRSVDVTRSTKTVPKLKIRKSKMELPLILV